MLYYNCMAQCTNPVYFRRQVEQNYTPRKIGTLKKLIQECYYYLGMTLWACWHEIFLGSVENIDLLVENATAGTTTIYVQRPNNSDLSAYKFTLMMTLGDR